MLRFVVFCAMLVVGGMPLHADVIHVDSAGLQRLRTEGVTVIDVRRAEEWSKTGVIEGSHFADLLRREGALRLGPVAAGARCDRGFRPTRCAHLP